MHCIRAFIGETNRMKEIDSNWINAKIIELNHGYSMIFLTDILYDDINELANDNLDFDHADVFDYLSPAVFALLKHESQNSKLAYIETDYFGGAGSQSAILFENGEINIGPFRTETCWDNVRFSYFNKPEGESAINSILKKMGIQKEKEKDEFDVIGIGHYRRMDG